MKTSCFQAYSSQTTVGGSAAVSSVRTSVGTPYCSPSQLLFHNDRLDAVITSHARDNLVLDINEKLASILQFYDHAVKEVTATNTLLRDGVVPQINELCAAFAPHVEIEVGAVGCQSSNKMMAINSSCEEENERTLSQSKSHNKNASTLHSVVCASSSSSSFPLSSSAPEAALDTAHGSSSAVGPPSQTSRLLNAHHRHREQNVLLSFLRDAAASIADGLYCLHEEQQQQQVGQRNTGATGGGGASARHHQGSEGSSSSAAPTTRYPKERECCASAAAALCFGEALWVLDVAFSCCYNSLWTTTCPSVSVVEADTQCHSHASSVMMKAIVSDAVLAINESLLIFVQRPQPVPAQAHVRSSKHHHQEALLNQLQHTHLMESFAAACAAGDALIKGSAGIPKYQQNSSQMLRREDRFAKALQSARQLIADTVINNGCADTPSSHPPSIRCASHGSSRDGHQPSSASRNVPDGRLSEAATQVCLTLQVLERCQF